MKSLIEFFKEALAELKQVAWLTPAQVVASTGIVIIMVAIMSAYISAVDFVLAQIFSILV
jgi:preprotein translocase SecE subunit